VSADLASTLGRLAVEALLAEATLAPKPGLVTPVSRGAHKDMDFRLLRVSARALEPCFEACAEAGAAADAGAGLLDTLKGIGLVGERAMFQATGGVNTHKGAVFCLGLLSAAMAFLHARGVPARGERACLLVSELCSGLVERELAGPRDARTAGERLYRAKGVRGARGQAEDGYPLLREQLLPLLRSAQPLGSENFRLACLDALLVAMAELEDSCLLARGGTEGLALVQGEAARVLAVGGAGSEAGQGALAELERLLARTNLSPGGAADLLAAGVFLVSAEARLAEWPLRRRIA